MDPTPVYLFAARWRNAEHLHLPRSSIEPVIWVNDDGCLDMYHPAMRLDLKTPSRAWDAASFRAIVISLLPEASRLIEQSIINQGLPNGFYCRLVEFARVGTYGKQDTDHV